MEQKHLLQSVRTQLCSRGPSALLQESMSRCRLRIGCCFVVFRLVSGLLVSIWAPFFSGFIFEAEGKRTDSDFSFGFS